MQSRLPIGSTAVVTSGPHKGSVCTIVSHGVISDSDMASVTVDVTPRAAEPPFGRNLASSVQDKYLESQQVAKALNISTRVLGMITGVRPCAVARRQLCVGRPCSGWRWV